MTKLQRYEQRISEAWQHSRRAKEHEDAAARIEYEARRDAGLFYVHREPGFACWKIKGMPGYFNTPQEALTVLENSTTIQEK